jgi:arylsulfatase A-like enzyme
MVKKRPNIILLISHDLGCHIGPYGVIPDACPRLNDFAAESARLDAHFVTSPGCSQSRSSLITGRYPHSNGQFGLSHLGWTLNRDETLLPSVLRDAGYRTAMFGIWHLHEWTLKGFCDVSDDVSTRDCSPEGMAEIAGSRAAQWLQENGERDEPFYLHVGFWEAHRPFCGQDGDPTELSELDLANVDVPPYLPDNEATRRECAHLRKSVESVDASVGRILDALDASGQRDNTIVIFTSDHGLPFPRAKGTLYDPGIQVAFLARWPGLIRSGAAVKALTSNADVMPTLLEAAGVAAPTRVQGESFLGALRGKGGSARTAVFAEKTYHEHYDPIRCVRTERFKYIRNFEERPNLVMPSDIYNSTTRQSMTDDEAFWGRRPAEELYDLLADTGETNNLALAPEMQEIKRGLELQLIEWMSETADPLLKGPIERLSDG